MSILAKKIGASSPFNPVSYFGAELGMCFLGGNLGQANPLRYLLHGRNLGNSAEFNGWLDMSENLTLKSIVYTSNFTAGFDNFGSQEAGVKLKEFNQTVGGESGWLKITWGDNITYNCRKGSSGVDNKLVRIKWKTYVPSTNQGHHTGYIGGAGYNGFDGITVMNPRIQYDTIQEWEYVTSTYSWTTQIVIGPTELAANVYEDDVTYIKDITIEQLNGVPCYQETTSARPYVHVKSYNPSYNQGDADGSVETDGIGEYLIIDMLSKAGSDTQGTWYIVYESLEGGNITELLMFTAGGIPAYFRIYINGSSQLSISTKISTPVTNTAVFNNVTMASTGRHTLIVKSDGSNYTAYQDDTNLGTPTNDLGYWHARADVATVMYLAFQNSGANYYANKYFALVYVNRPTTAYEDTLMKNFLSKL